MTIDLLMIDFVRAGGSSGTPTRYVRWGLVCSPTAHVERPLPFQMILPNSFAISSGMGADWSSIARVQRGPSEAARCASTEDHQAPSRSSVLRARVCGGIA